MKTLMCALFLAALVAGAGGCESLQRGWLQERELDAPYRAAALGQRNTVFGWHAFAVGLDGDLRYSAPLTGIAQGFQADLHYWTGRRDAELSASP